MRDVLILAIHLLVTLAKFVRPGGVRQVAAESILLKHQLLISNRSRRRAPNLTMLDRLVLGLATLFLSPHRIPRLSVSIRPATLFKFHKALVHRKYRLLFSSPRQRRKPGPKGPSEQLIAAIVEMKHRNPKFGCVRIAQQIAYAFDIEINKDVVRRVLAIHFRPKPDTDGPSWLTIIAQAKDSVWSVDLFRVESIVLRSHWHADRFDIRRDCSKSVAFGAGPHFCAGAWASRAMIADVALPAIFSRLANLRIVDDPPMRIGGWAFRGLLNLPLTWDDVLPATHGSLDEGNAGSRART